MLNLDQQKAVYQTEGPVRIIAGAGTGKTRTLISRIAYLIKEKKIEPKKILAISFSNKSAHRINEKLLFKELSPINSLTFETLSSYLIRKYRNDELKDYKNLTLALLQMWKEQPTTLLKCQEEFNYILVDDYQDTNSVEIEILNKLSTNHNNICVAGDPDQTICSHLGARTETMTKFENVYPNTVPISFSKNYRTPQAILKGAENLISNNVGRLKKPLKPISDINGEISLWESGSEIQMIEMITHIIKKSTKESLENRNEESRDLGDIAILFRTQEEGEKIYQQLIKRGFPCQISEKESFWGKKEIIDFLEGVESLSKWTNIKEETTTKFSKWITDRINKFIESQNYTKANINLLNHLIPFTAVYDHLPIDKALEKFLDETKSSQNADNIIQKDKINLLTLHSAKGMEFSIVIIVGLNDGNIPHKDSFEDPYWLSEERRLLYVGITRAKKELHLLHNNKVDIKELAPSRFLKEIGIENMEKGLISQIKIRQIEKREEKRAQMKLF